jgi:hypothetical protein
LFQEEVMDSGKILVAWLAAALAVVMVLRRRHAGVPTQSTAGFAGGGR